MAGGDRETSSFHQKAALPQDHVWELRASGQGGGALGDTAKPVRVAPAHQDSDLHAADRVNHFTSNLDDYHCHVSMCPSPSGSRRLTAKFT